MTSPQTSRATGAMESPAIRALQINLQRKFIASELALRHAYQNNTDILLIQEPTTLPNKQIPQTQYQQAGTGNAITLIKNGISYQCTYKSDNITVIRINNITVINVYASPNKNKKDIAPILSEIEAQIQGITSPLLISGDFNCGTSLFPSSKQNARSSQFDDFLYSQNLKIENYEAPTWTRNRIVSIIDYTLTRKLQINDWAIPNIDTLSDHKFLMYQIQGIPKLNPDLNAKHKTDKELYKKLIATPPPLLDYTTAERG